MPYIYNKYSKETDLSQYKTYLQNQNYVNQITLAVRETGDYNAAVTIVQSRQIQSAISDASVRNQNATIQAANAIRETLETGFSLLGHGLDNIGHEIFDLRNSVEMGFSQILEGQIITNRYLGKIQDLLKIPDRQKDRAYHIERGLMFLKNAFTENTDSEFYEFALEEFKRAEAIESKDFFSSFYIGYIHSHSTIESLLNPKLAEEYFKNSGRFYMAESVVGGTNFSHSFLPAMNYREKAAEAYLNAAEACYTQHKVPEAIELAAKARQIDPNLTKAGFIEALYLIEENKTDDALVILEKVIIQSRELFNSAITYLESNVKVDALLERLKTEAINKFKRLYSDCTKNMHPSSTAKPLLISLNAETESYVEARNGIDHIEQTRNWETNNVSKIVDGRIQDHISSFKFEGSMLDFVKEEKKRFAAIPHSLNLKKIGELEKLLETKGTALRAAKSDYSNNSPSNFVAIGCVIFFACIWGCSASKKDHAENLEWFVYWIGTYGGGIATIGCIIMCIGVFSRSAEFQSKAETEEHEFNSITTELANLKASTKLLVSDL